MLSRPAGAWEQVLSSIKSQSNAPRAGAWIETVQDYDSETTHGRARAGGLKLAISNSRRASTRRAGCGWKQERGLASKREPRPARGAWIETMILPLLISFARARGLKLGVRVIQLRSGTPPARARGLNRRRRSGAWSESRPRGRVD